MARPPIIQYDAKVVRATVTALETYLSGVITLTNVELANDSLSLTFSYPGDGSIQAREEAALDERILPQYTAGVWVRIVECDETAILGTAIGESRTIHTMEVNSWVTVQDDLPASKAGSASAGYIQAAYFARAVDNVIRSRLGGANCTAGIISVESIPGPRIPTPLKKMPSTHVIRDTYQVLQRTRHPYPAIDVIPEDTLSHGSFSLNVAAATALTAAGGYTKVASTTTAGSLTDWTHTDNRLTYSGAATKSHQVMVAMSVTFSAANSNLLFAIAINGTEVDASKIGRYVSGADQGAFPILLPATDYATGDYIEIFANSDKNGNLTPTAMTLSVIETIDT